MDTKDKNNDSVKCAFGQRVNIQRKSGHIMSASKMEDPQPKKTALAILARGSGQSRD